MMHLCITQCTYWTPMHASARILLCLRSCSTAHITVYWIDKVLRFSINTAPNELAPQVISQTSCMQQEQLPVMTSCLAVISTRFGDCSFSVAAGLNAANSPRDHKDEYDIC